MEKYNGWANRETWLVNLYYGEVLQEFACDYYHENNDKKKEDQVYECQQFLQDQFDEILGEEVGNLSTYLQDYLDLTLIDWNELADTYLSEF
jgi:hypothetical protein